MRYYIGSVSQFDLILVDQQKTHPSAVYICIYWKQHINLETTTTTMTSGCNKILRKTKRAFLGSFVFYFWPSCLEVYLLWDDLNMDGATLTRFVTSIMCDFHFWMPNRGQSLGYNYFHFYFGQCLAHTFMLYAELQQQVFPRRCLMASVCSLSTRAFTKMSRHSFAQTKIRIYNTTHSVIQKTWASLYAQKQNCPKLSAFCIVWHSPCTWIHQLHCERTLYNG